MGDEVLTLYGFDLLQTERWNFGMIPVKGRFTLPLLDTWIVEMSILLMLDLVTTKLSNGV